MSNMWLFPFVLEVCIDSVGLGHAGYDSAQSTKKSLAWNVINWTSDPR